MLSPVAFPTVQIEQAGLLAPLLGLRAGAALTVTPVSWPSLPAVVALVGPARAAAANSAPAAAAAAGGPWLVPDDPRTARRVALAAVLFLSAAYYAWRLLDGQVVRTLPAKAGCSRDPGQGEHVTATAEPRRGLRSLLAQPAYSSWPGRAERRRIGVGLQRDRRALHPEHAAAPHAGRSQRRDRNRAGG